MTDQLMGRACVIVVDDSPANVAILENLLREAGVGLVHGVTDPRMAMATIAEAQPDLVLLDLHMPFINGFELLRDIRATRHSEFLPVVMMTADVLPATRQRALQAGAKDFVTKPFDRTEVVLRVRNLLETRWLYLQMQQDNAQLKATVNEHIARERVALRQRARSLARVERALQPQALTMAFQPIVDLSTGAVVGVEALSRFTCRPQRRPNEWFAEAADVGRALQLELSAVERAVAHLGDLAGDAFMSINVSAATAMAPELPDVLRLVPADRIVLELTEHTRVDDYDALLDALEPLRARGVRVAVDDAGAGYSGLEHILKLSPDILKLDNALTRDVDSDVVRRALAASLVAFAKEVKAVIVAEGIETDAELKSLRALGVPWGQGFHLAVPGPVPMAVHRLDATA